MRRVIFNQKGGVGKSTIACNLAAIRAAEGLRTAAQIPVEGIGNLLDADYEEIVGYPALSRHLMVGVRVAAGR